MTSAVFGSIDGNNGIVSCGKPTLKGRSHCEEHRQAEVRRLWIRRENAIRALREAEQDYGAYLSEGYDL
jgi:hypothetical protein